MQIGSAVIFLRSGADNIVSNLLTEIYQSHCHFHFQYHSRLFKLKRVKKNLTRVA